MVSESPNDSWGGCRATLRYGDTLGEKESFARLRALEDI